jgi:putative transposase
MAHTYTTNIVHCVFSTKERASLISDVRREQLWAYVFGIAKNLGIEILAIGGMADHLHILLSLPPTKTLSETVRNLKANSSRFMSESGPQFSWQEGYGAFSVSPSQIPVVKGYIRNQAEHHKMRNFEQEFLALLKKAGVAHDPRYVFG